MIRAIIALAVLLGLYATEVSAHGYMTRPSTRAHLANRARPRLDDCPHCSSLQNVLRGEGLDEFQSRQRPLGRRPFAEPGVARNVMGPCAGLGPRNGRGFNGENDYNFPAQVWGFDVVDTFEAGEVIEVEWLTFNGPSNHMGVYSYRVCDKQFIVNKFLDPNYTPTQRDFDRAEECFQEGILPCNARGLNNTNCATSMSQTEGCNNRNWGCANSPAWFGMSASNNGTLVAPRSNRKTFVDQVRLPRRRSNHTLLTWRWDARNTQQIYFSCADIAIV